MRIRPHPLLLAACLATACTALHAADAFAPAGARATLSVEYLYESSGIAHNAALHPQRSNP